MPADLFVGRETELQASLDLFAAKSGGAVQDIVGLPGVGKSTYLERLSTHARELEIPGVEVCVFNLDMRACGEGFVDDLGAAASVDMLWEVFSTSRQLMLSLAGEHRDFAHFREVCLVERLETSKYQTGNELSVGLGARVDKAELLTLVKVEESDTAVRHRIRQWQSRLDSAFVSDWAGFTTRRRVLITLDTFQNIADDEIGQWFIRMALRLPNTLVVLARTPSATPMWRDPAVLHPVYLPYFTPAEVAEYVRKRTGESTLAPGLAETTHEFTDGHPGGIDLVGNLIMSQGGALQDARLLRQQLDRLPTGAGNSWAELVDLILNVIHEPELRDAVDAAAVAATFDGGLLAELIDAENPARVGVDRVISKLAGLRMLQQLPDMSGRPSGRFRLHEFIRLSVVDRLRTHNSVAWLRLHSVAAQYYFRLLADLDEKPYDSYGAWYRFEDPEWQEHKRDWLRHSGLVASRRVITRARFTLVFLEAFWWWGVYLPFPFMRRLLEDWNRASATWERPSVTATPGEDPDQLLLALLTELINDYPVTYVKPPDYPWDKLRDNLVKIRGLCGLHAAGGLSSALARRASDEEKAEMERVDAFIKLFLAHTRRFRDPLDSQAETFYQAAADAFREFGDEWTSSWISFERADMSAEQGDALRAASFLAEGAATARDLAARTGEWDGELLANLHRTWADVCWLSGSPDKAAREYGRAIANAYWVQAEPSTADGEPHGPDEYTQQFYAEMTTRTAQRIVALSDRPEELERFVEGVRSKLPPDAPTVPAVSLVGAAADVIRKKAFLPGPADSELLRLDTPFMTRWNVLYPDRENPRSGLDDLIQACGE